MWNILATLVETITPEASATIAHKSFRSAHTSERPSKPGPLQFYRWRSQPAEVGGASRQAHSFGISGYHAEDQTICLGMESGDFQALRADEFAWRAL